MDWAKTTARRDGKHLRFGFGVTYTRVEVWWYIFFLMHTIVNFLYTLKISSWSKWWYCYITESFLNKIWPGKWNKRHVAENLSVISIHVFVISYLQYRSEILHWYETQMIISCKFHEKHVLKKSTPKSISNFDSLHILHKKHCHHTFMTNRFPKCTLSRWINNINQYADKNRKLLCLLFEKGWNLTDQSTGNGIAKLQLAQ